MKKRIWVYIMQPQAYEMACDICGGINITWSEWEHKIWCFDCQKDTRGNGGIFDGPIPVKLCREFGISFDRYYLKSKKIRKMIIEKERAVWR